MKYAHFRSGQSTFICRVCDRRSRDVGGNGGIQLCPQCFEISGIENSVLDGISTVDEVREEVLRLAKRCEELGGKPDIGFLEAES